jgi:hypothetical protein
MVQHSNVVIHPCPFAPFDYCAGFEMLAHCPNSVHCCHRQDMLILEVRRHGSWFYSVINASPGSGASIE